MPTLSFPAGRGTMADLVHAKDWSATPLGSIAQWPQSLRTAVSLCLASSFPINIIWGPQRVQIYNDGYWPLCGDKPPASLGQDYQECWASAWEVVGEAFEQAYAGQTRLLENQRLFLDRYGYLEETFFTLSFSPIQDESGGVGGVFHPVTELTQQTLAARRLNILRAVPERAAGAQTEQETAAFLLETFRDFNLDLPFGALYAPLPETSQARLEGQVGLESVAALVPATLSLLEGAAGIWPLAEAARTGRAQCVEHLASAVGAFASGPYPEAPHTALTYPIYLNGTAQPAYFLVLGVSARRQLDSEYRHFFDSLVVAATTALAKPRALAQERLTLVQQNALPPNQLAWPEEAPSADEAAASILVVDDNPDIRASVLRILARQPQWTIRTAAAGLQALAAVEQQRPDLILSDVTLGLDAFGLLQALKHNPDTARLPVVPLSARAGEEATGKGLDQKADDYLVNPFAARELLERVRTQLDIIRTRRDNTQLRAAEEDLKKFKVLSDHAFDAFILMREDGSFAYLNELARQRWGYTAEEVEQLRVPDVDPIYQEAEFREAFAQAQQRGALPPFETLHRRKDGSTYPVAVNMGGVVLEGQPHMFAIARDITGQVAAQQQLRASEQRYRTLIEESPVATALYLGPEIRIQYASALMLGYWGKTASVLGLPLREALPELVGQPFSALLEQVFVTGKPYVGTRQAATLVVDGQPKTSYFTFTYKPLRDEAGQVYGIHHTAVDVTAEMQALQQSKESEARFRALVEQSPVPIAFTRGLDVVVESINTPMVRLMGKESAEQVLGRPMVEVLPLLESQAILQFANGVMATGKPFHDNEVPVQMATKSGEPEQRYFNVSYTPLIEAGQVAGIIHVAIDATEQVRARHKIESERERARLAIEVGGLGVFETNFSTMELVADARFNEIFGFDGAQDRAKYLSVFHPDDLAQRAQALELGLQTGAFEYEVRFVHAGTGQVRWVKIRGRVYRDAAGEPATVLGVAQDTTEQNTYTNALYESELRFRILADAAPNMVWAVNPDSTIRYVNRAFIDFVGVPLAQYETTGWGPYMHPDELAQAQRTLEEAIDARAPYKLEHRMLRHDGQLRWLLAQGAPSYYPNGELYGYVGSAIDITELKQTNEQLARTNRDLDNFIYTASHDLKAPITNIEGLLTTLEYELPPAPRLGDVDLILELMQGSVERFKRTIEHLTDISRLQQEHALPRAAVELNAVLADVLLDLAPLIRQLQAQLDVQVLPTALLPFSAKNLRSLLYNLVSNALKYRHPDRRPQVNICCQASGSEYVLSVTDNGLGIQPAHVQQLFGMFRRFHTHVEGSGVGLYMVKKMIENAGGRIEVQTEPEVGSTFTLYIPR